MANTADNVEAIPAQREAPAADSAGDHQELGTKALDEIEQTLTLDANGNPVTNAYPRSLLIPDDAGTRPDRRPAVRIPPAASSTTVPPPGTGQGAEEGPDGQLPLAAATHDPPDPGDGEAASPPDDGTDTGNEPAASKPPGSGRGRGRGGAEVVIRSLDPRLRSAMVVEDGVRRVVINARYPLYEVRKGDLWYQLETALREVCLTIPEATVPEFERKVNELMLVSLSLTPTRRRTRRPPTRPVKGAWARD